MHFKMFTLNYSLASLQTAPTQEKEPQNLCTQGLAAGVGARGGLTSGWSGTVLLT